MSQFIVKSKGYNVLFEELDETLCEYEGKKQFKQPHIDRAWSEVVFSSEYDALETIRELGPKDNLYTVLEDTGKVLCTHGYESGITSMVIKRVVNHD